MRIMDIENKIVMITGGIRGIGLATVQCLLRKGAKYVAVLDLPPRNDPTVDENLKILELEFGADRVAYHSCDITDFDSFTICFERLIGKQRYVDILINNAGSGNERNIDLIVDVNFKAVVKCSLHAIEYMGRHKAGRGGVVVITASYLGLANSPLAPLYSATKHAVVSFVRSMKEHNERLGVRVLCVCPGMTETEMVDPKRIRAQSFDFVDQGAIDKFSNAYHQKPENVATAIVGLIERGRAGAVWVVSDDRPAVDADEMDIEEYYTPS